MHRWKRRGAHAGTTLLLQAVDITHCEDISVLLLHTPLSVTEFVLDAGPALLGDPFPGIHIPVLGPAELPPVSTGSFCTSTTTRPQPRRPPRPATAPRPAPRASGRRTNRTTSLRRRPRQTSQKRSRSRKSSRWHRWWQRTRTRTRCCCCCPSRTTRWRRRSQRRQCRCCWRCRWCRSRSRRRSCWRIRGLLRVFALAVPKTMNRPHATQDGTGEGGRE